MMRERLQNSTFAQRILLVTIILNLILLGQIVYHALQSGLLSGTSSAKNSLLILVFIAGMAGLLAAIALEVVLLLNAHHPRLVGGFTRLLTWFQKLGKGNWLLFGLCIGLYAFLVLYNPLVQALPGRFQSYIDNISLRLFFFWLLTVVGMVLLKAAGTQRSWSTALAMSLVIAAASFKLVSFFPDITNYPFSLGWSEASRYYYASLYWSQTLYDQAVAPTVLHPTRYLLQAVPFIFPDAPIWVHRLWQDLLWIATTALTAYLLTRRLVNRENEEPETVSALSISDRSLRWMFFFWASLYLLMAPVYYNLLITVILVLWGFNRHQPWQTLLVVLLASVWAGISRINWFPVPGMLAATLFFLEESMQQRSSFRYLVKPVLWVVLGTIAAFAAQAAYAIWSGNPSEQFSSSFTSDLLWYRLLPNATYPLGILLSVCLVSLPLAILVLGHIRAAPRSYHWLRLLGIGSIQFVLFAGGIVVSVKIGGGSNLHNMDAFLTLLLITASYFLFNLAARELPEKLPNRLYQPSNSILVWGLLMPVLMVLQAPMAYQLAGKDEVSDALAIIQETADQATQNDEEVLFISERQLMMFNQITGLKLVPEYEKVFLMEMAMANNRNYLETFYENLKNHRFALIVSEPVKVNYQDRTDSFGEENNAWVERVSRQILCYYEPVETLKSLRTQLLIPRQNPEPCD
jgi:hypothetical protein